MIGPFYLYKCQIRKQTEFLLLYLGWSCPIIAFQHSQISKQLTRSCGRRLILHPKAYVCRLNVARLFLLYLKPQLTSVLWFHQVSSSNVGHVVTYLLIRLTLISFVFQWKKFSGLWKELPSSCFRRFYTLNPTQVNDQVLSSLPR